MRRSISSEKTTSGWRGRSERTRTAANSPARRIAIARVYGASAPKSEPCFLVDRVWPRGIRKEDLGSTVWLKDVAPSDALRKWFAHDPARWETFRRRYEAELDANAAAWQPILDAAEKSAVTLLFGAKDEEHNQAVALRDYLLRKLERAG